MDTICATMNTPSSSDFSKTCASILAGQIPLFGDLSDREYEDAETACALPVVAPDLPGCLAIAVLANRRLRVVASYQESALQCFGFSEPQEPQGATLQDVGARLQELSDRAAAALNGDKSANVIMLTDSSFARAMVSNFHLADASAN